MKAIIEAIAFKHRGTGIDLHAPANQDENSSFEGVMGKNGLYSWHKALSER